VPVMSESCLLSLLQSHVDNYVIFVSGQLEWEPLDSEFDVVSIGNSRHY
jgi:hypothetical protein